MKRNSSLTVPLLAILACFLWSTAFAVIKIGLQYSKPLSFAGIRFMIAGLLLVPFCGKLSEFFKTVRSNFRTILIISFFQTVLLYGLFFTGMNLVPGALGAIVHGSSPLVVAIIAHFIMPDDKMNIRKLLCIILGITGIAIISISRKPWSSAGMREGIGIAIMICVCITSAIGNIVVARDKKNIPPLILNSSQIFIGGFILFLISLPLEGRPLLIHAWEFYAALLWLAVISAVSFSLWFMLLKKPDVKVSELNIWKFIMPVSGAVLSWLILPEESPDAVQIIGMLFISGAIFVSGQSTNLSVLKNRSK